jgi:hypothetical protein
VRIALVENRQRLRQACRNIKQFMTAHGVNASATPRPRKRAVAEAPGE